MALLCFFEEGHKVTCRERGREREPS